MKSLKVIKVIKTILIKQAQMSIIENLSRSMRLQTIYVLQNQVHLHQITICHRLK